TTLRLSDSTEQHTRDVLSLCLANSTLGNYGSALSAFWRFCDVEQVLETLRLPAPEHLLCAFAASFAGTHVRSSVRDSLSGVRAWHIVHGAHWAGGVRLGYVLNGVERMAPDGKPPCPPVTMDMLELLHLHLDSAAPLDACVLAAADTAFWTQSCLGELFPTSATSFDPRRSPLRRHLGDVSANGTRSLHYSYTKTKRYAGDSTTVLCQHGLTDPVASLAHHLRVNDVFSDIPLFSYKASFGYHCLTKKKFLTICNHVWQAHGVPRTTGHSFRIGGTTELLARGVDPSVVKIMGRWSSDAFLRYWRDLEDIVPLHTQLL
ncbi:hypothetical protein BV20DRAFT_922358, partial [Pilatotrama ljubarskyi]